MESTLDHSPELQDPWSLAGSLYDAGLYLQAQKALSHLGNPLNWTNHQQLLLGARLANNVGAPRTSSLLLTRAFRRARQDPTVRLHYAYRLMQRRGPWLTWQFLHETPISADPDVEASLIAFRGVICAIYGDEESAATYLQKAHKIQPESPWIWTERSRVHSYLDQHEEAVTAARHALFLQPWYRAAVQQLIHLLLLANKDEEANSIFSSASSNIESGPLVQQWIIACSEREDYADIPALCQRSRELMPQAEKETLEWLGTREVDAYYALGDFERAASLAEDHEATKDLTAKLRMPGFRACRARLNVPFVRQDDATCAPASLASIAAYWNWDITHEEIAEAVCYGGTFPHTLRRWITERGWSVREFQITWQSIKDLINAGVPFLLATNEVGSGHMQVIEGYDDVRAEILIRDPNFRHHRRVLATEFLSRYAAFGPRGIAPLPPTETHRLQNVTLEAVAGYDRMYALSLALERNDRSAAAGEFQAMVSENTPTFLQLGARLALAEYDANPLERLKCLEDMDSAGLHHPLLTQMRLDIARNFRAETNYLDALQEAADPLRNKEGWDASFLLSLAAELSGDDRNFSEVRRLFFRYHALQPRDAGSLSFWGKVLWSRQQKEEALQLLRFACTIADKVEQFAQEYSTATQLLGRESESRELLQNRLVAAADKSSLPARTLYHVQRADANDAGAFSTLETAIERRPEDGDLLIFAALEWAGSGQRDKARTLLERAAPLGRRTAWLRAAAALAALNGEQAQEKAYWTELAATEPFALDVQGEVARLAAEEAGERAGFEHWESLRSQYPHHLEIAYRTAMAALTIGEEFAEPYLRRCITISPTFVSPRLDLMRILLASGRLAEAEQAVGELEALNPYLPSVWYWKGLLAKERGRMPEAQAAYRQSIQLAVDITGASNQLWEIAQGHEAHLELLSFLEQELRRQSFAESGFGNWYELASTTLDADDLEARLREFRSSRETSWIVWQSSVRHAVNQGNTGTAATLMEETISRFSLIPGTWVEAGNVQRRMGHFDKAEESLRRAVHLNPFHTPAWIQLASTLEAAGRRKDAIAATNEAIGRLPRDANLHWYASTVLARDGQVDAALAAIKKSVSLNPTASGAWQHFGELCRSAGKLTHWRDFATALSQGRPGNVEIAMEAAVASKECGNLERALVLVDHALKLRPRYIRAYLLKSDILALQRSWDGALKVCEAPEWGESVPAVLLGQASIMLYNHGDQAGAIRKMRQAVRQDAAYAWGWERLAEMQVACGKPREALEAAQHAAELQPASGYSWLNWAKIQRQLGNRGESLRLLKEAVLREPSYGPAVIILIDRLVQEKKADEADAYLSRTSGAVPRAYQIAAEALVALSRKQNQKVRSLVQELCRTPGLDSALLDSLSQASNSSFLEKYLTPVVYKQLSEPGIQPSAVIHWIERCFHGKTFDLNNSLLTIPDEATRTQCLAYYLDRLGDLGQNDLALPLLRNHAPLFQRDERLWSALGICLAVRRPVDTWSFLKSWREKKSLSPHMLRTVAINALAVGEISEAVEISRTALMMDTRDSSYGFHHIVMALHHALEDRPEEAKAALALGEPSLDTNWNKTLGELVSYAVSAKALTPKDAKVLWTGGRDRMAAANKLNYQLMGRMATVIGNAVLDREKPLQHWHKSDDVPGKNCLIITLGLLFTAFAFVTAISFSELGDKTGGAVASEDMSVAPILILPAAFIGALFALFELRRTNFRHGYAYAILAADVLIPIFWFFRITNS